MTKPSEERRSPDRHHVMQRLLRRVAVACLVLAAALLAVPRALVHLAILGPSTTQRLDAARQAVGVARSYGATSDLPAMAAAEREMASAEALEGRGEHHEARHAAERALSLAGDAQQAAIVRRQGQRIRAKQVVEQLDRAVDELEDLYNTHVKGLDRARQKELFSDMKRARAAAAALVLAWEQDDYPTVLEGESQAKAVIASVKQHLIAT
jgi:hypothetical protein